MRIRKLGIVVGVGVVGSLVAGVAIAGPGHDHDKQKKHSKTPAMPQCVVMDEPIDFAVKAMTADGPVFFCCKSCIEDYEAKPWRFAARVQKQRKALAALPKVQVVCPVSGEPVDEKVFAEIGGRKISFCCTNCVAKYRQKPSKYAARLADSYSYQTKCPVMGEEINPKVYTTLYNGLRIYYCCKGCDPKFRKDAAKYSPKLLAQGIKINPKKVQLQERKGQSQTPRGSHEHGDGHGQDHDH